MLINNCGRVAEPTERKVEKLIIATCPQFGGALTAVYEFILDYRFILLLFFYLFRIVKQNALQNIVSGINSKQILII